MTAAQDAPMRQGDPEPGISQRLAEQRAEQIREVGYELAFDLVRGAGEVRGQATITFTLAQAGAPLVLDFGGAALGDLVLDGERLAASESRRVANHVVIASAKLRAGAHVLRTTFRSKVAPTGTPLTVYRDSADGREYLYTLLVPADAHRLFPCFDQPDLKATFRLALTVPEDWQCVANAPVARAPEDAGAGRKRHVFEPTSRLPTYLFAFAAGPFAVVDGPALEASAPRVRAPRIFVRASKVAALERDKLFSMHARSVRWYERHFDHAYPFAKLDIVLCPGFPYGGMEHAGAIFYRESALVFDHAPTEIEELRRSTLIYHEVAHQWFGNLVTMRWFDDLWLKEGFATLMGFAVLEALEPERSAWLRFHQRVKPQAYAVDATTGTVPVYQQLDNLADAKSNYGAIVYNKAPAVLRELEQRLGAEVFRRGVAQFLRAHAFLSATWRDLLSALEGASGTSLEAWSRKWILSPGMPQVRAVWSCDGDRLASLAVQQRSAQGYPATPWPLRVDVLLGYADGRERRVAVLADGEVTEVPELRGELRPAWVLLNASDAAYGQFVLDSVSAHAVAAMLEDAGAERPQDPLVIAALFSALYERVREAEFPPRRFAGVAVAMLARERDALTHARVLGAALTTIERYLDEAAANDCRAALESLLAEQVRGASAGLALQAFRALVRYGRGEAVREVCRQLLDVGAVGAAGPGADPAPAPAAPRLTLGTEDRFLACAALLAAGADDAAPRLDALAKSATGDVARYRYVALAAGPDAATKQRYFASYLDPTEPPEQWVSESLEFFHWPGQGALTLPYLPKALAQVEWVKEHRKIFFMPAWIDAFLSAHSSSAALATVDRFLDERRDLAPDVRRKVLQSADESRRAVRVRATWGVTDGSAVPKEVGGEERGRR